MDNPTTTPETLEQVLTDDVLVRVADVFNLCYRDPDTGDYLADDLLEARLEILAALTPYLEAREQAIREDERRKAWAQAVEMIHPNNSLKQSGVLYILEQTHGKGDPR